MKNLIFILSIAALIGLASCEKDDVLLQDQEEMVAQETKSSLKSTKVNAIWDRYAAINYALRWSENTGDPDDNSSYNPDYMYWVIGESGDPGDPSNTQGFTDCANFVSQCIGTDYPDGGGLPTDGTWFHNGTSYPSNTWMRARYLMPYLVNKYNVQQFTIGNQQSQFENYKQQAAIGDLVFMSKTTTSLPYHAAIVTNIVKHWDSQQHKYIIDQVQFSGHTCNRRNADLYYHWNEAPYSETYYIVRL